MSSIAKRPAQNETSATDEASVARDLADRLGHVLARETPLSLGLGPDESVAVPRSAALLFYQVLKEMGRGRPVSVHSFGDDLTTQEAADYLHVSRPYFIKLLEQGKMKFHTVGAHRRIRFDDLEAYRIIRDRDREEAMQELANEAQLMGLGY